MSEGYQHSKGNQTIFRVGYRHKPYSQISNTLIRDKRLTYAERGVLIFVLSQPINWNFNMSWLLGHGGLGRDAAYRALKRYTRFGYCAKRQIRFEGGTMGPLEYIFTDDPLPLPEIQETGKSPLPGFTASGVRDATKKQRKKNTKKQTRSRAKGPTRKKPAIPVETSEQRQARGERFAEAMLIETNPEERVEAREFWFHEWEAMNGGPPLRRLEAEEFLADVGRAEVMLAKIMDAHTAALLARDVDRALLLEAVTHDIEDALESYSKSRKKSKAMVPLPGIFAREGKFKPNPNHAKEGR